MDSDDITDAFARWKVAHDAFQVAEQAFFSTVSSRGHPPAATKLREADPQFVEVQAKRADAEHLLLVAMKLLHERRRFNADV